MSFRLTLSLFFRSLLVFVLQIHSLMNLCLSLVLLKLGFDMLYVVRSIYIGNWAHYKDEVVYGTVVTDEKLARLYARRRRSQLNQHWRVEIVTLSEVVATEYTRSDFDIDCE